MRAIECVLTDFQGTVRVLAEGVTHRPEGFNEVNGEGRFPFANWNPCANNFLRMFSVISLCNPSSFVPLILAELDKSIQL